MKNEENNAYEIIFISIAFSNYCSFASREIQIHTGQQKIEDNPMSEEKKKKKEKRHSVNSSFTRKKTNQ